MRKLFTLLLLALALASCSQVNTLYNARKYFKAAQARPLNANGRPNNQAVEEYTKAIKKCGIILSNEKHDSRTDDALFLMARALYYKGNSAFQAKDQFESIIKGFPDSPFVGESHIYLAKVLRDINQKEQSYKTLQEFVLDSTHKKLHPKALMNLAQFSIEDKNYLQAQYWLQKILTDFPKSEEYREAFFIFGQNYYIEKDYQASLAEFQKIVKDRRITQQMKLEARYYIAMNQFMLGEHEQCKKTLKKLLKDETRPEKQSLARVLQARLYLAEGAADKGLAEIESIAKTYPRTQSSAEAQYHLGEYYFYEEQDLEKAGTAYGRVRTELSTSELAEPGQQKSTAINQLKTNVQLNPESNLQAYVDYCISAAENYFSVFSMPDSALVLYDRLISSKELAVAKRDTVLIEFEAQQAVVDSLQLALQALPEPEPEPEPEPVVPDSLAVPEELQETDLDGEEIEPEPLFETETTEEDLEVLELPQEELKPEIEDLPEPEEEPEEEPDNQPIIEEDDDSIPQNPQPTDTDLDESEELLGEQEEIDTEPVPLHQEPEDVEDIEEPEPEIEIEPELEAEDGEEPVVPEKPDVSRTEGLEIDTEPVLDLIDLPEIDLLEPESSEPDSLGVEEDEAEEEPIIDAEAEAKRELEAQRKALQRELTAAQNELEQVQKNLDSLDAVLLRYDRELIPLALFSKATILNKIGPDVEGMEAIYQDMLTEYPTNKYTNALEDMLAGETVRLIDPEEEAQELLMEEALGMAESDPESMLTLLEELAASEYPPIRLKATFRLAWFYSFELPDTTAAKPYLSEVLELDRNGEYGSLVTRFFDGTKFNFPKDEEADSLAMSDSLATEAETLEDEQPQELEHPVLDSEEEIDSAEGMAVEKPEEEEEPPPQEDLDSPESVEPQEDMPPVEDTEEDPPTQEEPQTPEPQKEETPIEGSPELDEPQEDTAPETVLETEIEDDVSPPVENEPDEEGGNPTDQEDGQTE